MRFQGVIAVVAFAAAAQPQPPTGSIVRFEMENSTLYEFYCPFSDVGTNLNDLGRPLALNGIHSAWALPISFP